jgi:hypothetical protein
MNLQLLQTSLSALIKSRPLPAGTKDRYLEDIGYSDNLLLIQKIAFWWRKVQVEPYCRLTSTLLKATGKFDDVLSAFLSEKDFSSFRDEVGRQFLSDVISKEEDSLIRSVAEFELAVILLKSGEEIEASIPWNYEPYELIGQLLNGSLNLASLKKGWYEVTVSSNNAAELFRVKELQDSATTTAVIGS